MTLRRRCTGTALYPHRVTWYDEVEGSCPTCAILAFARRIPTLTAEQIATAPAPKMTVREWLRGVWRSIWR